MCVCVCVFGYGCITHCIPSQPPIQIESNRIKTNPQSNQADGPYAVVLAPTRELAQQIDEEIVKLAHFTNFRWDCDLG